MGEMVGSLAQGSRILVVDDEEPVRRLLADGLGRYGFHVSTAPNGASALQQLQTSAFDGIVLDIQMSPVNGWEVVDYLNDIGSDIVRVLLSAHVDVAGTVSALRSGVFDVLQKPVGLNELSATLQAGLRAKAAAPEDLSQDPSLLRRSSGRIRIPVEPRPTGVDRLIGDSEAMRAIRQQIKGFARFRDVPALVVGETGTGKEVVASALHDLSCPSEPFVSINCAAIPRDLFESELFGHEAGAFTGARTSKMGLLETAGEGTLFLDEIGEMPAHLQPKLLRVLQTREYRRVGGKQERRFKARVVSATNRRLSAQDCDSLRSDLYFRLSGFTIALPPLRERKEDIEKLAVHFLSVFSFRYPGLPTRFHPEATEALQSYSWPGNVRELQAVVERAAMGSSSGTLERSAIVAALRQKARSIAPPTGAGPVKAFHEEVPVAAFGSESATRTAGQLAAFATNPGQDLRGTALDLNELQRQITVDQFAQNGRNLARTARALGIPRTTLRDRLKRYGEL